MTEPLEDDTRGKRPLPATILAVLTGINTALLFAGLLYAGLFYMGLFYADLFGVEYGDTNGTTAGSLAMVAVLAVIGVLITVGLWRGSNVAWALAIIASVIRLFELTPVAIVSEGLLLVLALLPTTRAFYKAKGGSRSQFSVSLKGTLQLAGIIFGGLLVLFIGIGFLTR